MNQLAAKGKSRTHWIFVAMLMVSINVIIDYQMAVEHIDEKKLFQQVTRFLLTVLLMYFVLRAKQWAVIVMTVVCGLGILVALFALGMDVPLVRKIPIVVPIVIYGACIYHLNFTRSFKEYFAAVNFQEKDSRS